jgi:predicted DsbA family dithiol-disulfide isomerase
MAEVRITEYTDPGCPWAFSAEPFRRRLDWLYGDQLEWRLRMVVLSESPEEYLDKGFDPKKQSAAFKKIAREHGMPIDSSVRSRMAATLPACRAVIATRLHAPEKERHVLRWLRIRHFAGELLDENTTLEGAASDSGLDPVDLHEWMDDPQVDEIVSDDMEASREPMPAARALDDRLANWSGGRRYTCPSYEITRLSDGVTVSVPGFQPFAAYDVIFANLVPAGQRRETTGDVAEVIEWAEVPLASQEVATVCDIDRAEARERLGSVADERHIGADGIWSLK